MFCEMEPPARESVKRMNPSLWTLGTTVICVKISTGDAQPLNSLASWVDGDSTFHLQPRDETYLTNSTEGDAAIDRLQECGTGGSVWKLGSEAICKVKSWYEGRQLEATTIDFVRKTCPEVPMAEVIYSWIDRPINRTFLIMKRVQARTLNTAWPHLSAAQHMNIAKEVAHHCSSLARITSSRYESISGCGVYEYWLMGKLPASNPSWFYMTVGPFSSIDMKTYMTKISCEILPERPISRVSGLPPNPR
ncbi:uncharacterized protein LY89DRAFT_269934 [Mollisia scopiformis]|uniref:Uncharacterized protein n=1 Tax=Mollisia scopiformis TaxID=149040 RepID=A0A132BCJ9_MOLSC|nr:uncharacterized protein LY89DRAFT_269934 [Mollisia scopiformis]KUJ10101.1 hypothetical protein LY89DRAFT_269934 [Mollisia scopiformis]